MKDRAICANCSTVIVVPVGTHNWQHEDTGLCRCPNGQTWAKEGAPAPAKKKPKGGPWPDAPSPGEIRAWARANGYEVGDRGRISLEIRKAFQEARR